MKPGLIVASDRDPIVSIYRVSDARPILAGTVINFKPDGTVCNVASGGTLAGIAAEDVGASVFTDGVYIRVLTSGRIWCLVSASGKADNGRPVQYDSDGRVTSKGDNVLYNARFASLPQAYGSSTISLVDAPEVLSALSTGIGSETLTYITDDADNFITITDENGTEFQLVLG